MSLFIELKRRNVFRVGVAYAILAWLLIQIVDVVLPTFQAPLWIIQTITFVIILGFPLALFLAWAFELTPEGLKTEANAKAEQSPAQGSDSFARVKSNTLNVIIMGLLVLAVGFLLMDRYVIDSTAVNSVAEDPSRAATNFQADTVRSSLVLPPEAPASFIGFPAQTLAISPDGKTVAYITYNPGAGIGLRTQLAVRHLGSLETRILPGTQGAKQPFFSPDGQWLAFFTQLDELKKIALSGGRPVTLLEDLNGAVWSFGDWLEDGRVVYSDMGNSRTLWIVNAEGGEAQELTTLNSAIDEVRHGLPIGLPGAEVVLFNTYYRVEEENRIRLEALILASGERRVIQEGVKGRLWLDSGHLLVSRDDVLMVAPFDPLQLAFTGPAVPVNDEMRMDGGAGQGDTQQAAVSSNGTLVYAPKLDFLRSIYLVNRDGSSEALNIRPQNFELISVSPDGQYATLDILDNSNFNFQTWLYNIARNTMTVFSEDGFFHSPFWHPDSQAIAVRYSGSEQNGIWIKSLDGDKRLLLPHEQGKPSYRNGSWHPDGRHLALTRQFGSEHDIVVLTLGNDEDSEINIDLLMTGPAIEFSPRFSPDGRWLAYQSNKAGTMEVYVRGYPDGEEYIVSAGQGGENPAWSADGSELYFSQPDESSTGNLYNFVAVTFTETPGGMQIGPPEVLFPMSVLNARGIRETYNTGGNAGNSYAVLPDGRFLMARGQSGFLNNEIVLVQNWFTEVLDMAPVE